MPRIARIYALNYPHHITQRGNNRETVFFDDEDKKFYLKILNKYSYQWNFDIWAYCLMPNHVHILVVPKREDSLAKGIGGTNLVLLRQIAFMARCKTDMLSGLIRKSPPASAGALRAGRLAPLFPPGQRPYGPAAKEGDNNFPLWQRGNKGDFVNCRSSVNRRDG
jgi:REP element-mobilizing transposase RayT